MTVVRLTSDLATTFSGVLLGTAVGDALGLPSEGLSPERIRKRWPGECRMRLLFGRSMISDDTEHTLMVAQALLSESEDPHRFQRILAWKFRWWFLALPGGVGLATAKACRRLWVGFPSDRSAVPSAGSGPAMRSAVIGAYFSNEPELRRAFTLASSRLTHRGWQAETAALAVAEAAALAIRTMGQPLPHEVLEILRNLTKEEEWQALMNQLESSLSTTCSVSEFARTLGLEQGVSGYALHVVSVALYAWLRRPHDFRYALVSVIQCGGDTDTAGAILGALAGASGGERGIPTEWINSIWEWPRSIRHMKKVAECLAIRRTGQSGSGPVRYFWPGLIPRNLLFIAVVLVHGFRRLMPPY